MNPIVLIGLFLATRLGKTVKTVQRLELYPKDVLFDKSSKKLFFDIEVLNPTKNSLTVQSLYAGIYVGGKKLGNVERNKPITIQPTSRTLVRLPIKPNLFATASLIAQILLGVMPKKASIKGTVRALGVDTTFAKTVPIQL